RAANTRSTTRATSTRSARNGSSA
ncbi:MAG: hypothetical protein QOI68_205, partial [Pseudonocardiales bacterium]|nr:hypothetical protein [Pseudonocardiales bacterium]